MLLLLAQGLLNKIVNMSERRENISFYDFQVALASAGEIVLWKYIIGEERAAVNVKRREMAGSKKGDRKGDCSYKAPPHHNLATLIIIWSFILLQVLSSIFVSCERVVKKYSAQCTSITAWCHWTPMGSNVKIYSLWLTLFSDVLSCYIFAIWQSRSLDCLGFSSKYV